MPLPPKTADSPQMGDSSPPSGSASSRYETMRAAEKFHRLQAHPHLQAEAIADHYSKLAAMSMELRKMVEIRKNVEGCPELDRCIESLAKKFVDHHREDFGIELSWQNADVEARDQ
jgi:hypothetical protein